MLSRDLECYDFAFCKPVDKYRKLYFRECLLSVNEIDKRTTVEACKRLWLKLKRLKRIVSSVKASSTLKRYEN